MQTGGVPGTQPESGSQVSVPLQTLPSSQVSGVPGTQSPLRQVSWPLQTSLSRQSASLVQQPWIDVWTHPMPGSHASIVQAAPSLQFGAVPVTQPVSGSQVSTPSQA